MSTATAVREQIQPRRLLALLAVIAVGAFVELRQPGAASVYDLATWAILVPWLLAQSIRKPCRHRLYHPLHYGALVVVGVLQYLDGEWRLVAGLFALAGVAGLVRTARDRFGGTEAASTA